MESVEEELKEEKFTSSFEDPANLSTNDTGDMSEEHQLKMSNFLAMAEHADPDIAMVFLMENDWDESKAVTAFQRQQVRLSGI